MEADEKVHEWEVVSKDLARMESERDNAVAATEEARVQLREAKTQLAAARAEASRKVRCFGGYWQGAGSHAYQGLLSERGTCVTA